MMYGKLVAQREASRFSFIFLSNQTIYTQNRIRGDSCFMQDRRKHRETGFALLILLMRSESFHLKRLKAYLIRRRTFTIQKRAIVMWRRFSLGNCSKYRKQNQSFSKNRVKLLI